MNGKRVGVLVLVCSVALVSGVALAHNPSLEWETIHSGHDEQAYEIVNDYNGNAIVVGLDAGGSTLDYFTLKVNNSSVVWENTYDSGGNERGAGVAVDTDNNIISAAVGDSNAFLKVFKYTPNGTEMWNDTIQRTEDLTDPAVGVDSENNIYIGSSARYATNDYFYITKYDANGTQLWNTTVPGTTVRDVRTVQVKKDDVYLFSTDGSTPKVYAFNKSSGIITLDQSLTGSNVVRAYDFTRKNGSTWLVGENSSAGSSWLVERYNSTGDRVSQHTDTTYAGARSLEFYNDTLVVTGDSWVIREYSAYNLSPIWTKTNDGQQLFNVEVDSGGNIYVAIGGFGAPNDIIVRKYGNATIQQLGNGGTTTTVGPNQCQPGINFDAPSLILPNQSKPYTVDYVDLDCNSMDVTGNATVTSNNTSVVTVNTSTQTLNGSDNVNTTVWVNASYTINGSTYHDNASVVVAEVSVANLPILPPIYRVTAVLNFGMGPGQTGTVFFFILATLMGAAGAAFAGSTAGIAVMQLAILVGWFGGWVGLGLAMVSVFVALFIGLNTALNVDYGPLR